MSSKQLSGRLVPMVVKPGPHVRVPNAITRDGNLSLRALGLLTYLMSHNDKFEVSASGLAGRGPDGLGAIRSICEELEAAGYLVRERQRNSSGRFSPIVWTLRNPHDAKPVDNPAEGDDEALPPHLDGLEPNSENPSSEPESGSPDVDGPDVDGPPSVQPPMVESPYKKTNYPEDQRKKTSTGSGTNVGTGVGSANSQGSTVWCSGNPKHGSHRWSPMSGWCYNGCGTRMPGAEAVPA